LVLTVVDIRAVGPGVWNSWKRQLLRTLFEAAEEMLLLGHKQKGGASGRRDQAELAERLAWEQSRFAARLADARCLLAVEPRVLERNARSSRLPTGAAQHQPLSTSVQEERGATLLTIYAKDEPGIFYRIAAAISLAGGNIIDARIHTSSDGMALDNFLVQDAHGTPFDDPHRLERLEKAVLSALSGQEPMMDRLEAKALPLPRAEPSTSSRESSSITTPPTATPWSRSTRAIGPALLSGLAEALFQSRAMVHSAHIATYGERAVDVFYLTDRTGAKIESPTRLKGLQARLLRAAGAGAGAKLQIA
jgi:[protein-PII] uridylyltransferase